MQDEIIAVGESLRAAAGDGGRSKGPLEPAQASELRGLMAELCRLQQEAECRNEALNHIKNEGGDDLGAVYTERVAQALKKRKAVETMPEMKQFSKKLGVAGGAAAAAADDDDSDDEIEMQEGPGGDQDKEYKCPLSGYFEWLENPMRAAGCNGSRQCVFSKAAIVSHIKRGPNQGHQFPRCPIRGCNAYIKNVGELAPDRDMAQQVKAAKRQAQRRERQDEEEDDDETMDMTQGGYF